MRRKAAALLACLCLLPGCAAQQASPADDAESFGLWFVSADGSSESAVMQETREWSAQPDAQALMGALLRGPEEEMLSSPFPAGVSLRAITYGTDGVLQVDLSEQYGGLTGIDLTLADCCIALTLCQLPGVEAVRITVEGEEIPYRSRQVLGAADVLLSGLAQTPEGFFAMLCFPRRDGTGLEVEHRQVERRSGSSAQAAALVEQLLSGPCREEGVQLMPQGTRIRNVTVEGGICRLDLSEEFATDAPHSQGQAALVLYALVNTLCTLREVERVQLLVEGEILSTYGGVAVDIPLEDNPDLIRTD